MIVVERLNLLSKHHVLAKGKYRAIAHLNNLPWNCIQMQPIAVAHMIYICSKRMLNLILITLISLCRLWPRFYSMQCKQHNSFCRPNRPNRHSSNSNTSSKKNKTNTQNKTIKQLASASKYGEMKFAVCSLEKIKKNVSILNIIGNNLTNNRQRYRNHISKWQIDSQSVVCIAFDQKWIEANQIQFRVFIMEHWTMHAHAIELLHQPHEKCTHTHTHGKELEVESAGKHTRDQKLSYKQPTKRRCHDAVFPLHIER